MEQHRTNPTCATCHARMDPLGFAFENFNAIGEFRDKDGEFADRSVGHAADGKSFKGPDELKEILKEKKDLFSSLPDREDVDLRPGPGTGILRQTRRRWHRQTPWPGMITGSRPW